jgi:hypothetical protein
LARWRPSQPAQETINLSFSGKKKKFNPFEEQNCVTEAYFHGEKSTFFPCGKYLSLILGKYSYTFLLDYPSEDDRPPNSYPYYDQYEIDTASKSIKCKKFTISINPKNEPDQTLWKGEVYSPSMLKTHGFYFLESKKL